MKDNTQARFKRRIRELEILISEKQDKPEPNNEAYKDRQHQKKVQKILNLVKTHPDREIFLAILELLDDTKN